MTTCTSECGNSMYKGLTIIDVESGNPPKTNSAEPMYDTK